VSAREADALRRSGYIAQAQALRYFAQAYELEGTREGNERAKVRREAAERLDRIAARETAEAARAALRSQGPDPIAPAPNPALHRAQQLRERGLR